MDLAPPSGHRLRLPAQPRSLGRVKRSWSSRSGPVRKLTLLRHAKSSWGESGLHDSERPLSGRGERDAAEAARRLDARGDCPALILTSHARRATATAGIVAAALGIEDRVHIEPRLYLASPDTILELIAGHDEGLDDVLVVGHNPGLTELANRLLPELALDNLPTAAMVAIGCDASRWAELEHGARRLLYYDTPKAAR